jgi:DNA-binding transcriptional MocR family regulator
MITTESRYLYDQVFDLVQGQIETGSLQPGDRLPSLRRMSRQLKVSIATVMQGYTNLEREGLINARAQSGFFVNAAARPDIALPLPTTPKAVARDIQLSALVRQFLELSRAPGIVPLGLANPGTQLLPAKALSRMLHRVSRREAARSVEYGELAGDRELRRQIAYRSSVLGSVVDPETIVITNGASEALALSLKSVTNAGDTVAVESPTYFLLLQLIEDLGLKAVEVPADPVRGLDIDAFEKLLGQFDIRCLLCVANFNNPYGSVMPDDAKRRLVGLANERGIRLIEDDIYGELHFAEHRPRPLASFDDTGNVVTCSSFSKTLAPGYRIGWIIANRDREQMLSRKHAVSMSSCSVTQMAVAEYLAEGGYDRHVRGLRRTLMQQVGKMRHQLSMVLPVGTRISQPQGGFVLWVELPRGIDAMEVFNDCLSRNVSILPGSIFSPTRKFKNCIRISCGHPWSSDIENGLRVLGEVVHSYAS